MFRSSLPWLDRPTPNHRCSIALPCLWNRESGRLNPGPVFSNLEFYLEPEIPVPHSGIWNLKSGIPKRPNRDLSPIHPRPPPLRREPPGILLEQLVSIDPIAHKCPAAKMVNEQIMCHRQFKPGPPRPLGEIIVIKEPEPKPLIEPADLVINGPLHEQTKPRKLGHGEPLLAMLVAPSPGKPVHLRDIVIRHVLDKLRRRHEVGHGPDRAQWGE